MLQKGDIVVSTENVDKEVVEIITSLNAVNLDDGTLVDIDTGIEIGTSKIYTLSINDKVKIGRRKEMLRVISEIIKNPVPEILDKLYESYFNKEPHKQYFHKISKSGIAKLMTSKTSYADIAYRFKQPAWCGMVGALDGFTGCWSLLDVNGRREIISANYCSQCESFICMKNNEYLRRTRLMCRLGVYHLNKYLGIKDYDKIESGDRKITLEEIEKLSNLYGLNKIDIIRGSKIISKYINMGTLDIGDIEAIAEFREIVRETLKINSYNGGKSKEEGD
ncbi:MAG: hypothetical protein RRY36_05290 [Bacteroidaceae bacterium]